MSKTDPDDIGALLEAARSGDRGAIDQLFEMIEKQIIDTERLHDTSRRDVRHKAAKNEHFAIYTEALESLAHRERMLLKIRLESQRSFDDVAKQLGFKSADAARKAFHAAKAKLLLKLVARGVDPYAGVEGDPG